MRAFFPALLVLFALVTVGVNPAMAQRITHTAPVDTAKFIDKVIELTNMERAKVGAPPVKREESLIASAQWMASDMANKNYFGHADQKGRNIDTRIPEFGYGGYSAIGENIAAGQRTPADVVAAWMKSPGHRANLLNADFREIGIGFAHVANSEFRDYWVQDFGTRQDIFPVIINNDVTQTKSPAVKLYVHGEKWAQKVRFSADGKHWTDWEDFQSRRDWKLDEAKGKKTIFVELRNGEDIRHSVASIELVTPPAPQTASAHPTS